MNRHSIPAKVMLYITYTLIAFLALVPLYLTIVTAFKTPMETYKDFFGFPKTWTMANIDDVIHKTNLLTAFINSISVTAVSVSFILLFIPACSYAISRNMNRYFYKILFYVLVSGMFIPFCTLIVPLSKIAIALNISVPLEMVPIYIGISCSSNVFLVVGYLEAVPYAIDEAASIDGASVLRTYFCVIFPIMRPILATVAILATLWVWNDFFMPLVMMNTSQKNWTIPIFQYNFASGYLFNYNQAAAALFLTIIPILIVYTIMQKYIIKGIVAGSVKS